MLCVEGASYLSIGPGESRAKGGCVTYYPGLPHLQVESQKETTI